MDFTIELARLEDLPAILALQQACYRSEAELYHDFSIPPLTQDLAAIAAEFARGLVLKGVLAGRLIASVRGFRDEGTCYAGKLMVHEDYQNRGFGRRMLLALEAAFEGCARLELFTGCKSGKNLYLYHSLGYREFKRVGVNDQLTMIYLEKTHARGGSAIR